MKSKPTKKYPKAGHISIRKLQKWGKQFAAKRSKKERKDMPYGDRLNEYEAMVYESMVIFDFIEYIKPRRKERMWNREDNFPTKPKPDN
mgnify:CR=1 FL=1